MGKEPYRIKENNPDFFYFNIPDIVTEIVRLLIENKSMPELKAIDLVYNSMTYQKLQDRETGYWLKEPYELFTELLTEQASDS